MGSGDGFYPEEGPTRELDVNGGLWDVAPVTVAQWREFVADSGHTTDAETYGGSVVCVGTSGPVALNDWSQWWSFVPGAYWAASQGPAAPVPDYCDEHPVVHVLHSTHVRTVNGHRRGYQTKQSGSGLLVAD